MKLFNNNSMNYCIVPYTKGELVQGKTVFETIFDTHRGSGQASIVIKDKMTVGERTLRQIGESFEVNLVSDMISVNSYVDLNGLDNCLRFCYPGEQLIQYKTNDYVDVNGSYLSSCATLNYRCSRAIVHYKYNGKVTQILSISPYGIEGYYSDKQYCARFIQFGEQQQWSAAAQEFISSNELKTYFRFYFGIGDDNDQKVQIKCTSANDVNGSFWQLTVGDKTISYSSPYPNTGDTAIEIPHQFSHYVPWFTLDFSVVTTGMIMEDTSDELSSKYIKV